MCNLTWWSNEALKAVSRNQLKKLLQEMEERSGGDGNGIGGFINGKPFVKKGVKFPMDVIAGLAKKLPWDRGCIIHTRKASVGPVCDENCHPFLWKDQITGHAGTWMHFRSFFPQLLLDEQFPLEEVFKVSDSRIIAKILGIRGPKVLEYDGDWGDIITMGKDSLYACGSLYIGEVKEGAPIISSTWIQNPEVIKNVKSAFTSFIQVEGNTLTFLKGEPSTAGSSLQSWAQGSSGEEEEEEKPPEKKKTVEVARKTAITQAELQTLGLRTLFSL